MQIERRDYLGSAAIETRSDGGKTLIGYAAKYYNPNDKAGTEFRMGEKIVERIAPGAFSRALAENQDVAALVNHDPNQIIGRSSAGTLVLEADSVGLRYRIDLPDTQAGRDIAESVRRGDVTGSSFGFSVNGIEGRSMTNENGLTIRTLKDVKLYDVGPVTFPAYSGTTTGIRSSDSKDLEEDAERYRIAEQRKINRLRFLKTLDEALPIS